MNSAEREALNYLKNRHGYEVEDLKYNSHAEIDFIAKDGKKFEVKTFISGRRMAFTEGQLKIFPKENPTIIIFHDGKVIGEKSFNELLTEEIYKFPTSMVQTVRLGDETYKELADFKAWLIVHGFAKNLSERQRDFDWAIKFLLDEYASKRALKKEAT